MKDEVVCQITANYLCAGVVFVGSLCVDAAPIIKWMKGKQRSYIERYCQNKGWKFDAPDLEYPSG